MNLLSAVRSFCQGFHSAAKADLASRRLQSLAPAMNDILASATEAHRLAVTQPAVRRTVVLTTPHPTYRRQAVECRRGILASRRHTMCQPDCLPA